MRRILLVVSFFQVTCPLKNKTRKGFRKWSIISSPSDSFEYKKHEPDDPFQDFQDLYQLMIQSNQPSNPIQSFFTIYSQQTIPKIFTHEPLDNTYKEVTLDDETFVTFKEYFIEYDSSNTCSMPPLLMADHSPA